MDPIYKSSYYHDLATHKEFKHSYTAANVLSNILLLAYSFLMVWDIQSFYESYYVFRFLIFALIVCVIYIIRNPRKGDLQYKRMLQTYGGQPYRQEHYFTESGLHVVITPSGNQADFTYDQFRYVIESKNLLILVMRYRSCIIIDKSTMSADNVETFYAFLKAHCPKLRGKQPRKTTLGNWCRRIFIVIFAASTLWALMNLPGFTLADRIFHRLHNDMTYQEMADELSELDIDICLRTLREMEEYDAEFLEQNGTEYYDGAPRYQKVADLLYWEGEGIYQATNWWDPSNSGVYWVAYEPESGENIYTDFLLGLSAMDDDLDFTNIQEDITGEDIILSFDWNGATYSIQIDYPADLFDPSVVKQIGQIVDSDTQKLYVSEEDYYGLLLYYGTRQNVRQLNTRTTLHFKMATRKLW